MGSTPEEPTEPGKALPLAGLPATGDELGGRYRLTRELGRGGMGLVWEGEDTELERRVAIKMVTGLDPKSLARMRREARSAAKLAHPNVAAIYDVDIDSEPPFIVMELVEGGDLGSWLASEPRPSWRAVLDAFEQAGLGLDAAHRAGLVHRDFKPANVILGGGRVRVVDFGLARSGSRAHVTSAPEGLMGVNDPTLTAHGVGLGTPVYMAPEQHEAGTISPATDVFAFACSLYQALYGERPYVGRSPQELYEAKLEGPPSTPPQNDLAAMVPARLFPVVVRGLAVDPDERWSSMAELVQAMRRTSRNTVSTKVAASVVATGAALWLWAGLQPDPSSATDEAECLAGIDAFERNWTKGKLDLVVNLEKAGGSVRLSDAVRQTLDDYSEQWMAIARGTCGPQEDPRLAATMTQCLARVRGSAERRLERAIESAKSSSSFPRGLELLIAPGECGETVLAGAQSMPTNAEERQALETILEWARDEDTAFTYEELEQRLARATEIGHLPTIAELELALSTYAQEHGDSARSLVHCDRAYLAATEGGAEWTAYRASDACVLAAAGLAALDQARLWSGRQGALSLRLRVAKAQHLRRQAHLAVALARGGEMEEARRIANEVDEDLADVPPHYTLAILALTEIGMVALWADDFDDAVRRLERAHGWAIQFHSNDPDTMAYLEGTLATAYRATKRFEEAEVLFERGLVRPQSSTQLVVLRLNYALMLGDQPSRIPDGLAMLEPARADLLARGRENTIEFANVLSVTGQLYVRAGDHEKAREALKAAKSIYLEQLEPEHIRVQMVEQLLAEANGKP